MRFAVFCLVACGVGCTAEDFPYEPTNGSGGSGAQPGDAGADSGDGPSGVCGDGMQEGSEECDDGAQNSDTAPNACRTSCLEPGCGDGVTDTGEACDDGPNPTQRSCSSDCSAVGCVVGAGHPTIQSAVDDPSCSLVIIPAGTYLERVNVQRGVTLEGDGPGQSIIDGEAMGAVLVVAAGAQVKLQRLTITNGRAASGAGISSSGELSIQDCAVEGNRATTQGGGIHAQAGSLSVEDTRIGDNVVTGGSQALGGGVYLAQNVSAAFTNATLEANTLSSSNAARGAGIYAAGATLTISGGALSGNRAESTGTASVEGGALYASNGTLTLGGGCAISDNSATGANGSFMNSSARNGGGLSLDQVDATIDDAAFSNNRVQSNGMLLSTQSFARGGAIYAVGEPLLVKNASFDVNVSSSVAQGQPSSEGGAIYYAGDKFTLENSALRDNVATGGGGGAVLTGSAHGGGLYLRAVSAIARGSTFSSNVAEFMGAEQARGGGIFIDDATSLSLEQCLFSGNRARANGGAAEGGGLAALSTSGLITLSFTNSTFSGNVAEILGPGGATTGGEGGGIRFQSQGGGAVRADFYNLTVTENTSGDRGGGLSADRNNSVLNLFFSRSIISNNAAKSEPDCSGTLSTMRSRDYNVVGTSCPLSGGNGSDVVTDLPLLAALADNGGPSPTHALLPGSPALDAGQGCPGSDALPIMIDQRGAPRPSGADCDIGAFEQGAKP